MMLIKSIRNIDTVQTDTQKSNIFQLEFLGDEQQNKVWLTEGEKQCIGRIVCSSKSMQRLKKRPQEKR